MNIPADLKYTNKDEWLKVDGSQGVAGITDHAQEQLSDVVFVEILVAEGDEIKKGDSIATIESVKAAADVYSPASGKVTAINEALPDAPETVNASPFDDAWLIKLELSNLSELDELLTPAAYQAKIEES